MFGLVGGFMIFVLILFQSGYTDLTFHLPRNKTLLITGDSGIGKTSLMRVIADMWPHQGILKKHFKKTDAYFLPQKPYFPVGRLSLKQQLVFPAEENEEKSGNDGGELGF